MSGYDPSTSFAFFTEKKEFLMTVNSDSNSQEQNFRTANSRWDVEQNQYPI